jgi:hypothetical protein
MASGGFVALRLQVLHTHVRTPPTAVRGSPDPARGSTSLQHRRETFGQEKRHPPGHAVPANFGRGVGRDAGAL